MLLNDSRINLRQICMTLWGNHNFTHMLLHTLNNTHIENNIQKIFLGLL